MIPVSLAPDPTSFQEQVRFPGNCALLELLGCSGLPRAARTQAQARHQRRGAAQKVEHG